MSPSLTLENDTLFLGPLAYAGDAVASTAATAAVVDVPRNWRRELLCSITDTFFSTADMDAVRLNTPLLWGAQARESGAAARARKEMMSFMVGMVGWIGDEVLDLSSSMNLG